MSTYYNFQVSTTGDELSVAEVVAAHLEKILLLGGFFSGSVQLRPDAIRIPARGGSTTIPLFKNARAHLWEPATLETTKAQLKALRATGNVDSMYDIDVLRMSEPRIVFIKDTLEAINRLPTTQRNLVRKNAISASPQTTSARTEVSKAFKEYLSAVISQIDLIESGKRTTPTSFAFRKMRGAPLNLKLKRVTKQNLFGSFIVSFSTIASFGLDHNKFTSFRLKSYEDWLEPSAGEPFEILGTLSRDCNAKCDFCYVLGNPSNTAIKLQRFTNKGAADEAFTRLSFFKRGMKLPTPTYDTEEITTHPAFLDVCAGIRETSSKCISITTNGYRLNEATILRLKELAPIDISLSLNAITPETRKWLMGGASERGLSALDLLDRYDIPSAVTLAAWPRVSFEETKEAVRYIDKFNVRSISVLLGGYTKLFPNPPEYQIPHFWNRTIDAIAGLRDEIDTPLLIQPRLYEEVYRFGDAIGRNIVTGVNKLSPAKNAGIQVYDEIIEVNGRPITTRNECLAVLSLLRGRDATVGLTIQRRSDRISVTVSPASAQSGYLYGKPFNDRYGIHLFGENLPLKAIRQLFAIAARHRAQAVLIATSMIVQPFLAKALNQYSFLTETDITFDLQVIPNKFLGGNIVMGDMLVIDDFIDFLAPYLEQTRCDLVLVPSAPFNQGGWCRDMKGQPFELLRRAFRTPIEMVEANYFE